MSPERADPPETVFAVLSERDCRQWPGLYNFSRFHDRWEAVLPISDGDDDRITSEEVDTLRRLRGDIAVVIHDGRVTDHGVLLTADPVEEDVLLAVASEPVPDDTSQQGQTLQ